MSIGVTIFDHGNEANDTQADDNDSSSDDDDGEAGIIIHAGNYNNIDSCIAYIVISPISSTAN